MMSSVRSTCPNHLNLLFLIIKLTGSNPKSSLSSSLFRLVQLNPAHPSAVITHFSAIHLYYALLSYIGQGSLPCIRLFRQLHTQ